MHRLARNRTLERHGVDVGNDFNFNVSDSPFCAIINLGGILMFLKDDELKKGIIEGAQDESFGNIACDLLIKEVIAGTEHLTEYELKPAESVFVATVEKVQVPPNMFAQVIARNSAIRLGLAIAAPIYQPGHYTRIFFRATNVSNAVITLKKNSSVCSLMVYQLSTPSDNPYTGIYADEFDYRGVGDFHSVKIPSSGIFERKLKELENLEHRIYGNVMLMLTIFVAIFSLVNLNTSTLLNGNSLHELLSINFIFLSVISTLVLLIAEVIGGLKGRRFLYFAPLISLALAFIVRLFF